MHEEWALPFKAFVPTMMELLEDADGMVRDTAKHSVVKLFKCVNGSRDTPYISVNLA